MSGPKGAVTKDFSHLPCEIQATNKGTKGKVGPHFRVRMWFGGYKQACAVNTLKSHISNMIIGCTEVSTSPRGSELYNVCAPEASVNLLFSSIRFKILIIWSSTCV